MTMLDRALGVPPMIEDPVTDLAGLLNKRDKRSIEHVLAAFEARFPQVTAAFVTCHSPQSIPLRGYLFWLFNRSQIVPVLENGGSNRLIMIGVDPSSGTAACMVGYGLEPFLQSNVLAKALADASFDADNLAASVQQVLQHLSTVLEQVCDEAPRAFGLQGEPLHLIEQLNDRPFAAALTY